MGKRTRSFCEKCGKKTIHEVHLEDNREISICLRCMFIPENKDRMLDPTYIDPRERYSLKPDRAIEEHRWYTGRPF